MIAWEKVPWPLWVYVALTLGQALVVVLTVSLHIGLLIFFIVFMLAWTLFLLRAVRWLWIATVTVGALTIAVDLVTGSATWHGDFVGLIALGLLLLPTTRRFFAKREVAGSTENLRRAAVR